MFYASSALLHSVDFLAFIPCLHISQSKASVERMVDAHPHVLARRINRVCPWSGARASDANTHKLARRINRASNSSKLIREENADSATWIAAQGTFPGTRSFRT